MLKLGKGPSSAYISQYKSISLISLGNVRYLHCETRVVTNLKGLVHLEMDMQHIINLQEDKLNED